MQPFGRFVGLGHGRQVGFFARTATSGGVDRHDLAPARKAIRAKAAQNFATDGGVMRGPSCI